MSSEKIVTNLICCNIMSDKRNEIFTPHYVSGDSEGYGHIEDGCSCGYNRSWEYADKDGGCGHHWSDNFDSEDGEGWEHGQHKFDRLHGDSDSYDGSWKWCDMTREQLTKRKQKRQNVLDELIFLEKATRHNDDYEHSVNSFFK